MPPIVIMATLAIIAIIIFSLFLLNLSPPLYEILTFIMNLSKFYEIQNEFKNSLLSFLHAN